MSEDIRDQFFPMSLPGGVIGRWVERAAVASEIRELNTQIFPRSELRLFEAPPERQPGVQRLRQSYTIVGLELNESYGPLVKMAYFIHADRRAGFEQAFSMAPDSTAGLKR